MMTELELRDDASFTPAAEFMRTLGRLNHALERASRRMEASWGVTAQQRIIIRFVGRYPGTTAGQLARHLHLDPGTVSAAIDRLEERGLVERRRTERDRRRVMLGLTSDGRAVDGAGNGPGERAFERLLDVVPAGDIGCARRVLSSLSNLVIATLDEDAAKHDV